MKVSKDKLKIVSEIEMKLLQIEAGCKHLMEKIPLQNSQISNKGKSPHITQFSIVTIFDHIETS